MRRSCLVAAIFLFLVAGCGTKSRKSASDDARAVSIVRSAVPPMEAYYQDHGTYAGVTPARLRRYNPSLGQISITKATEEDYCLEAVAGDSHAFLRLSDTEIMLGSCDDPSTARPYDSPPSNESVDGSQSLRASSVAIEVYRVDHDGYLGMTLSKLREIDYGLPELRIVKASKREYCVELGVGADIAHMRGPGDLVRAGKCPT